MSKGQNATPKIPVGDPMPHLVLPDPSGGQVDFRHQSIAGDTVLLWLPGRAPEPASLAAFAGLAEEMAAIGVHSFLLTGQVTGGDDGPDVPVVLDPEGRVPPGLGVSPPCLIVGDPRGRLSAVLEGDAFAAAAAHCREI